ncbi:MAG: IS1634 family transposase, partial [Nostoc sp.]
LISILPESEFIDSNLPGYKFAANTVNYAGIEQRWLVVQSQERRESDLGKREYPSFYSSKVDK